MHVCCLAGTGDCAETVDPARRALTDVKGGVELQEAYSRRRSMQNADEARGCDKGWRECVSARALVRRC